MSVGQIEAGKAWVIIGAVDRTGQVMDKIFSNTQRWSTKMMSVGSEMALAGAAMFAPFAAGINIGSDFDTQIRELGVVTDAANETADSLQRLRDQARDLGKARGISPIEVAKVQTEIGRAGFTRNQVHDMTPAVLDLARSSRTDPTRSGEIIGSTLRQFEMGSGEAARVADVLAMAANKSAISVSDLGESLKYAGPLAHSLGMSLEELVAMVAVLGNLGIKGEMAGTALRNITVRSAAAQKKFNDAGIVTSIGGNLRKPTDILGDVANRARSMGSADRTKMISDLFGLRGMVGAMPLVGSQSGISDIGQFVKDLQGSGGTAAAGRQEIDGGIGGAMGRMRAAIEDAGISISDALTPALVTLLGWGIKTVNWINDLIKEHPNLTTGLAAIGAGFLTVGTALVTFGGALKVVNMAIGAAGFLGSLGSMGPALAGLATPIGAVAIALTALVAFFPEIDAGWDAMVDGMETRWNGFWDHASERWLAFKKDVHNDTGIDLRTAAEKDAEARKALPKGGGGAAAPLPERAFWDDAALQNLADANEHAMINAAKAASAKEAMLNKPPIEPIEIARALPQNLTLPMGPALEGVERGTLEAVRRASENQQSQQLATIAGSTQLAAEELSEIRGRLEDLEVEGF